MQDSILKLKKKEKKEGLSRGGGDRKEEVRKEEGKKEGKENLKINSIINIPIKNKKISSSFLVTRSSEKPEAWQLCSSFEEKHRCF